jgi:uncharacterized protein DUF1844
MGPAEGEEANFKVTDRRRRSDEPPAAPPEPARGATPPPASGRGERSLVGLFTVLGSSALMALGEAPDPATGKQQRDLPTAAEMIDVLLLLRDKTEDHRSDHETQVLEQWLYDLQMRYVAATKQPG